MKNYALCLLLLFLGLLPACIVTAAPKAAAPASTTITGLPVTFAGDRVTVNADINDALSQDALTPFMALLKAYPQARFFDLSWMTPSGGMGGTGASIGYDRMKHVVTVEYFYGGGDDPEYNGNVRFAHVRESTFAAILTAHPKGLAGDPASEKLGDAHDNNAAGWGGFQFLYQPRYSCRVRVVRAKHRMSGTGPQ